MIGSRLVRADYSLIPAEYLSAGVALYVMQTSHDHSALP
jgi:hypothetical protein